MQLRLLGVIMAAKGEIRLFFCLFLPLAGIVCGARIVTARSPASDVELIADIRKSCQDESEKIAREYPSGVEVPLSDSAGNTELIRDRDVFVAKRTELCTASRYGQELKDRAKLEAGKTRV